MDFLPTILGNLATRLPLFIVWLVGAIVALVRWREHPRVSLVAVVSLTLLATITTMYAALAPWMMLKLYQGTSNPRDVGAINAGISAGISVFDAACWAGVVYAIFAGRRARV